MSLQSADTLFIIRTGDFEVNFLGPDVDRRLLEKRT